MSSANGGRTLADHVVRIIHTLVLDKDVELDEEPCTAGPHESLRCPGVVGVALWLDLWRVVSKICETYENVDTNEVGAHQCADALP